MGGPTPPKDVNVQSAERSVSGGDNLLGIVNASLFSGNPAPTDILNGNPRFVVTTLNNGLSDSSPSAFSLREAVASADNQEVWLPAGRFAWQDNPLLVPNVVSLTGISESASRIDARLISAETIDEIFLSPSFTHSRVSAVPLASTVQAPVGNDATWRGTTEEPALHPSGYPLLQTPVEIDAPLLTAPLHRHHGESISQDRDHNSQDQDDHWQATVDEIFQELSALV